MVAGRDPNGPGRLLPKFAQCFKLGLDLLESWADGFKQTFAGSRRRNAPRRPGQEPNPQARLEFANGVAQCRLRYAQLRGCLCDAALSSYGDKGQEVTRFPRCIYRACFISPREL